MVNEDKCTKIIKNKTFKTSTCFEEQLQQNGVCVAVKLE